MIEHVAILGAGTMGSWIAGEVAAAGFRTTVIDVSAPALEALSSKQASKQASKQGPPECSEVALSQDLRAAADVDLVIETVTEDVQIKAATYARLADIVRDDAIVTTNTSILVAKEFAGPFSGSPRFAYFHFLLPKTVVEIMPTAATSTDTILSLVEFAKKIGESPVQLDRESPGYLLGAILGAAFDAALDLCARGVADPARIDAVWRTVVGTPVGPLEMLDRVGLDTSLRIRRIRLARDPDNESLRRGIGMIEALVEGGRLGLKSGSGIFEYRLGRRSDL